MLVQERRRQILLKLADFHSIKAAQLVKEFCVSAETIRRDLEYLESIGQLKRVHGGAIRERDNSHEESSHAREIQHIKEKQEIGELATQFVREGQCIALDVSTTNTEFARALKKKFCRLTVVTNSLPIAYELSTMSDYKIILPGGILDNNDLFLSGDMARHCLAHLHIDTLFLSMSGISLHSGLTDYGIHEWYIKMQMFAAADKCFVLADSSKFDAVSQLKVCQFKDIEAIITDSELPTRIKTKYIQNGVRIVNTPVRR